MSEKVMNIYQKLIEVRKTVPYLQKENAGSQYKFVSSSQTLASVRQKMDEVGLILIPKVTGHKLLESPIETKDKDGNIIKRTTTYFTELDMEFTWVNAENPSETITSTWYGQGVDIAGEKGVGKAMTYAEKYFFLKFFNIATDKDDPDAFQDKHDIKPDTKPKEQQPPQPQKSTTTQPQQQWKMSDKEIKNLWIMAGKADRKEPQIHEGIKANFGKDSVKDLTEKEYKQICLSLTKIINAKNEAAATA